ncbi:MAG: flagellar basal body L-ring protein FlgH [Proteobacteria bacterium]|nr:flagellar basal body L-ring protein FlgH [Pseudomonadota bacterium]
MKLSNFKFQIVQFLAGLNHTDFGFINIKMFGMGLSMFLVLFGCAGTEYTSRIRNEPFNIENVFRQAPSQQVQTENKSGTIWPGSRSTNTFFSDERAIRVGDIITVSIIEVTASKEQATTDLKRTGANVGLGVPNFFGLETNKIPSSINPASMVTATVKNDFSGDGATTRDGSIKATIAAKVVEVMPNGNLAIEGKREISLNNERKEILFQGIVRPKDIAANNSVLSTQVADAKVILTGVGVIGEKQSPGWLARIFDVVWPF